MNIISENRIIISEVMTKFDGSFLRVASVFEQYYYCYCWENLKWISKFIVVHMKRLTPENSYLLLWKVLVINFFFFHYNTIGVWFYIQYSWQIILLIQHNGFWTWPKCINIRQRWNLQKKKKLITNELSLKLYWFFCIIHVGLVF